MIIIKGRWLLKLFYTAAADLIFFIAFDFFDSCYWTMLLLSFSGSIMKTHLLFSFSCKSASSGTSTSTSVAEYTVTYIIVFYALLPIIGIIVTLHKNKLYRIISRSESCLHKCTRFYQGYRKIYW
jgi:hypothetical protein